MVGVEAGLYEGTKHSFATDANLRGVPERALQSYLGHRDVRSTRLCAARRPGARRSDPPTTGGCTEAARRFSSKKLEVRRGVGGGGAGNRTRVRATSIGRVYVRVPRSISGRPVARAGGAIPLAGFVLAIR